MSIKAIFLDIDNTLLDFDAYVYNTMETGFAHFGLKKFEPWMYDIFHVENNKLWRQIEEGTLVFSELEKIRWNRVFAALGIEFEGPVFEKYFRAALWDSAIFVPGAMELLKALKERYVLCSASNGPYAQQLHRLEIAGMKEYFDYLFISEDIGASKPSKEFFDRAFSRMKEQFLPEECVMIGDSLTSDIAGGKAYGMKTCFYNPKKKEGEADLEFDTLEAISEYFSTLGN